MIEREMPKTGLPCPDESDADRAILARLDAELGLAMPCDWARLALQDGDDDAPVLCCNPGKVALTFRDYCDHAPENPFLPPKVMVLCQAHISLWVGQPQQFHCPGCGCPLHIVGQSHVLLCPPMPLRGQW